MIELRHIGKSADDLRFFIYEDGAHAGGITVHSVAFPSFSYGVAVSETRRRRGVARAALTLLFEAMRRRGFTRVVVQVAPRNEASLALHRSLGFAEVSRHAQAITLERML
ncbi:MAG: GNAT family N-acetyltransferase [Clostridia bacterium]|nr:GNAT family N-acetyltransferase [Clostridia bacterium]